MTDLTDFLDALDDSPFEELPVDVRTFVTDPRYLGLPELSEIQYHVVEMMSQIYYEKDLARFMDRQEARQYFKEFTKTEIILKLGKGSGKDYMSTIGCCYIVYKLLCLKDPALYFGKPPGDAIDIINIAINAEQAKNVFFKGFKKKIVESPWFRGKYHDKVNSIDFDKSVAVYSGHSERESHEGLNILLAILDEISGFAMDNPSGLEKAKTGQAVYDAFRGTVDSRFGMGKVVLLSFPRYKGCFISQRYDEVIAEKREHDRSHTFTIDPYMDPNDPDNQWTLNWKEDEILRYKYPGFYAICRPTWEVNPTKRIEDFLIAFLKNEPDARGRFLAQPSEVADALFGRVDKIESSLVHPNPLTEPNMLPMSSFVPIPDMQYFIHADLAQKVDKCAVALSHVEKWQTVQYGDAYRVTQPHIVTDAVAYWKPGPGKPVDLAVVKDWVIRIRSLGFKIELITFDRWGAVDMQRDLTELGFKCETLSVLKKHYEDLMVIMYEDRLTAPMIPALDDELRNLRVVKDKVDHPRAGGKDLSDALCGSVFNAATRSVRAVDMVAEVHDFSHKVKEELHTDYVDIVDTEEILVRLI